MGAPVKFRFASPADQPILQQIFHEAEVYYEGHNASSRESIAAHVAKNVIPALQRCEFLLAECDGGVAGMASFGQLYPAPNLGGHIQVKDIFVREGFRNRGVGRAIIQRLAALALERGCTRVDWTAETSNPRALEFYDRLGVPRVESKVYYRLEGDTLAAFAGGRK